MLSNKLAALFRFEAKDVADIWIIATHRKFELYEILKSFPEDALTTVKWSMPVTPFYTATPIR